ncbi:MAG: hypothetical protein ACOCXP_00490 [Candidatus Dojkabacteria bacterium]
MLLLDASIIVEHLLYNIKQEQVEDKTALEKISTNFYFEEYALNYICLQELWTASIEYTGVSDDTELLELVDHLRIIPYDLAIMDAAAHLRMAPELGIKKLDMQASVVLASAYEYKLTLCTVTPEIYGSRRIVDMNVNGEILKANLYLED